MKKLLLVLVIIALMFASFIAGELHVIYDAIIYTTDCYDPQDPTASMYGKYDQRIFIELDGNTFEHGMYQC